MMVSGVNDKLQEEVKSLEKIQEHWECYCFGRSNTEHQCVQCPTCWNKTEVSGKSRKSRNTWYFCHVDSCVPAIFSLWNFVNFLIFVCIAATKDHFSMSLFRFVTNMHKFLASIVSIFQFHYYLWHAENLHWFEPGSLYLCLFVSGSCAERSSSQSVSPLCL